MKRDGTIEEVSSEDEYTLECEKEDTFHDKSIITSIHVIVDTLDHKLDFFGCTNKAND